MSKPIDIAVIGAGLAGLACATRLQSAGLRVAVFDKSRGPAGRMSTRRGDGWQCDHGAQYFTARDPRFCAEVARWQAAGCAAPWPMRLRVFGDEVAHASDIPLQRFVGVPRMTAPARHLASKLPLDLQITINAIEADGHGWRLRCTEHGWLPERFGGVVLAVPAPQAVPLLTPAAPELARLAAGARMRASWALMLRYDAPVALDFDAAFVNRGPLRWVARDSSKPGRGGRETWLLHATAEWSEARLELAPDIVEHELLAAFGELGAPPPAEWTAHRWRYADSDPPLDLGCVWDAGRRIGLAGDWLNGGKVEGAWLSGHDLAGRMLGHADG